MKMENEWPSVQPTWVWWSWKRMSYAGLGWVFGPWELGSSAGTAGWQQITQRLRPHKLLEVPAWAPTGSVAVEEVCAMELEHRSGQVTIAHPFRLGSVSVSLNWEAGASFCFISSRCCSTYASFKLVKKIGGFSVKKHSFICIWNRCLPLRQNVPAVYAVVDTLGLYLSRTVKFMRFCFLDPVLMAAWHKMKHRALLHAGSCSAWVCTAQGDTDSVTCCGHGLVLLGS